MSKIWCFDCDNTLCITQGTDYVNSKPDYGIIEKINKLYEQGNTIKIFTGRGSLSGRDWRELTEKQLKEWGVKYHQLLLNKPPYDVFIDDLAYNVKEFRVKENPSF